MTAGTERIIGVSFMRDQRAAFSMVGCTINVVPVPRLTEAKAKTSPKIVLPICADAISVTIRHGSSGESAARISSK